VCCLGVVFVFECRWACMLALCTVYVIVLTFSFLVYVFSFASPSRPCHHSVPSDPLIDIMIASHSSSPSHLASPGPHRHLMVHIAYSLLQHFSTPILLHPHVSSLALGSPCAVLYDSTIYILIYTLRRLSNHGLYSTLWLALDPVSCVCEDT